MEDLRQRVSASLEILAQDGVFLSQYGNHAGQNSIQSMSDFFDKHQRGDLFDIEAIHRAMQEIPFIFQPASTWSGKNSYAFKHLVEHWRQKRNIANPYITNGDFVLAMVMCGYKPKFNGMVNCVFKVAVSPETCASFPDWQ